MKLKLRHDNKVCCPYLESTDKKPQCAHPLRCIRSRGCECKYYHNNESTLKAQMLIVIKPRKALNDKGRLKYQRRIKNG